MPDPAYQRHGATLYTGDCLSVMAELPPDSVDAIVTDPPYGLSFMGKDWDHGVPGVAFWVEALRVAKPGAHLLAFGGTRTHHRLWCAVEDAGWAIRDTIGWLYGSGFPKSLDVSKAIDKAAGAERKVVGRRAVAVGFDKQGEGGGGWSAGEVVETAPATDAARQWSGWGTALKPAWEPIIVARAPFKGTVAANVLAHGTGGINVDGCRIDGQGWTKLDGASESGFKTGKYMGIAGVGAATRQFGLRESQAGRWPANIIHDGSDEVLAVFPETTSGATTRQRTTPHAGGDGKTMGLGWRGEITEVGFGDSGSAARFFYCAKASREDRDDGCEGLEEKDGSVGDRRPSGSMSQRLHADEGRPDTKARNHHPTVKPTSLMRYLCRLVTPPGGVVMDPFSGSGSTGKAAVLEGFRYIGVELSDAYQQLAIRRIEAAVERVGLFAETTP